MTIPAAAPAAAPTPAPAPAAAPPAPAPAAPEPVALPVTPAPAPAPAVEPPAASGEAFEPTGDAGLDLAAQWVSGLGLDLNDPMFSDALESGDFSILKAKLASMGAKAQGWEQYIALAEKGIGTLRTQAEAKGAEIRKTVHEAVGGEENWKQISEWASANADPTEKEAINAMFDAGGLQARAAALLLSQLYQGASGTVVTPQDATAGTPAATASASTSALSPDAYKTEVAKLVARIGAHKINGHPEYAALQQRRLQYRG